MEKILKLRERSHMRRHVLPAPVLFFFFYLFSVCFSACVPDPFGNATEYNLFSLGAVSGCNTTVEGRVAADGPVTLYDYSIGSKLSLSSGFSLVSSDAINWSGGSVWHGGITGATIELDQVKICDSGNVYTSSCCVDENCNSCQPGANKTFPIDFPSAQTYFTELSQIWSSFETTEGATIVVDSTSLYLTCSANSEENYFSKVYLEGIENVFIQCASSQTVLINYDESVSSLTSSYSLSGGISSNLIIHHFTAPTLNFDLILPGSVFAPLSRLEFNSGAVSGNVVVGEFLNNADSVTALISEVITAPPDSCANSALVAGFTFSFLGAFNFRPVPKPSFVQFSNGTGSLTGTIARDDIVFDVNLVLSQFTSVPPASGPLLQLKAACYVSNGGVVDPTTWRYYSLQGTFTAPPNSRFNGAVFTINPNQNLQIGNGADGKNVNYGIGARFPYTLTQQGSAPLIQSGIGTLHLDIITSVITRPGCNFGQVKLDNFAGCISVSTPPDPFNCCVYTQGNLVNGFCTSDECIEIPGWELTDSLVQECDHCCVC